MGKIKNWSKIKDPYSSETWKNDITGNKIKVVKDTKNNAGWYVRRLDSNTGNQLPQPKTYYSGDVDFNKRPVLKDTKKEAMDRAKIYMRNYPNDNPSKRKAEAIRRRKAGEVTRININETKEGKYAVFRDGSQKASFSSLSQAESKAEDIANTFRPAKIVKIVNGKKTTRTID